MLGEQLAVVHRVAVAGALQALFVVLRTPAAVDSVLFSRIRRYRPARPSLVLLEALAASQSLASVAAAISGHSRLRKGGLVGPVGVSEQ